MMEKRKIMIGDYDTAIEGLWTLSSLVLSDPDVKSEFVSVPGRSGDLDISTVLTDGDPVYSNRTLEVTLESSEGTRLERNERISYMINKLDGFVHNIILPDDQLHYLVGRVSIKVDYSDLVHSSVKLTANCEPWLYNIADTHVVVEPNPFTITFTNLRNKGRKSVVPEITISGSGSDPESGIRIEFEGNSWNLSDGIYTIPEILLKMGSYPVGVTGVGFVDFRYREAVLR